MIPRPTYIYHITHVKNLPLILAAGGLRTCKTLRSEQTSYTDIAYQTLQDRRADTQVPCGVGGTLHDYVPFYFAPRSPMLFKISKQSEPQHQEGQTPIIHLVSTIEQVQQADGRFAFTDGHGIMELTNFYDDLTQLDRVDWQIMNAPYWRDTVEDNDRKRRRQAEFLVHDFFPWHWVQEIGVKNVTLKSQVEARLSENVPQPLVKVMSCWYY